MFNYLHFDAKNRFVSILSSVVSNAQSQSAFKLPETQIHHKNYFHLQEGKNEDSAVRFDFTTIFSFKVHLSMVLNAQMSSLCSICSALTLSFSPSKLSSCVPSTPLAVNSAAYWSMFMDTSHRHTCWLFHSEMGRLCHRLLLMVGIELLSSI